MMERIAAFGQIIVGLLVASFLAAVVRTTTIGLNHTLGPVWPFSLAHCHLPMTLGCRPQDQFALATPGRSKFDLYRK